MAEHPPQRRTERGLPREVDWDAMKPGSSAVSQGNMRDVGGSNPSPLTIFSHDKLGLPECPYLERWVLDFRRFSIRIHRWFGSDDKRAFHNHAWWFFTLVLWGSYIDRSAAGNDHLRPLSCRFRPAQHSHTVDVQKPGRTWTLLITGRTDDEAIRWGFWVNGKLIKRDKYFAVHGHHPCEVGGQPVRIAPDGRRINLTA